MMTTPQLILLGAGGHARACIDVIEQQGHFKVVGLVGLPDQVGDEIFGYPVFSSDEKLSEIALSFRFALIAVGQIKSSVSRIRLFEDGVKLGFEFPRIVSPHAHVSPHAVIGAGTIVMHGAIVNAGATIGENCIINSRALIEHDSIIEDHCHISTGSVINGSVAIGRGSFIGSGSIIKEGIKIGRDCIVGMGCFVRHDVKDRTRFLSVSKS